MARLILLTTLRYSEFDELRAKLCVTFPNSKGAMPPLPPKSIIRMAMRAVPINLGLADIREDKFRHDFLEKRRAGLAYFLKYVLELSCQIVPAKLFEVVSY